MAKDEKHKDKGHLSRMESFFGIHKPKDAEEPEPEMVTVKEEKKRVKRVVKAKPMARRHLSEAFETSALTKEDIEITESVINGIGPTMQSRDVQENAVPTFACLKCGCPVPESADRCPGCNTLYIRNLLEEDLLQLESVEDNTRDEQGVVLSNEEFPCMHFNAESGTINCLKTDLKAPDFEFECSHCGTLIGFDTDTCPICGTKFELADTGIVSLFADMEFDKDCTGEIACPLCGEKGVPDQGKCPACKEIIHGDDPKDPDIKVAPVIHNQNVVFMHLDVESGEVNYLQRLARTLGFEQLTVKLDGIGSGRLEHETDWKSLSRI
jgi:RNA polymerase subunit RPABC4/transcription elongation factor Spt4